MGFDFKNSTQARLPCNILFCRFDPVSGLPGEVARQEHRTISSVRTAIEFASFSTQNVADALRVWRGKNAPAESSSAHRFRRKKLAEAIDFIERTILQRNRHRSRTDLQRQPSNHCRQSSSIDRAMIATENVAKRIRVADQTIPGCDASTAHPASAPIDRAPLRQNLNTYPGKTPG